ncbi:MAG: MBOAT family protein, partial [Clostridiales bacterium]|nr:MBOAT family protein [Clostridiales bacterium]
MIFSSASFLFAFLPCVAIVYYLLRSRTARNVFLTFVSLFFYAWGEPWFVLVMLLSIVINWFIALRIGAGGHKKAWLVVGLVCDLGLLAGFKYLGFLMENVNWIFHLSLPVPQIVLPIGISFFTFQAISYIVDVYRGDGRVQKSLMNVCLYISFFPQLIAGPIVRYQTFDDQITTRRETLDDFCEGVRRFIVGLAKKVLLANNLAALADTAFAMQTTELSLVGTWLAAASYMLQLYFDFSGYSDMAIGLARMFGFHLLENFNLPFIARSIAGFWKRWHISLTSWFRDYLYFPLGGSRVSKGRLLF